MINFNLYKTPDYKFSNLITNKSFGVDADLHPQYESTKKRLTKMWQNKCTL